MTKKSGSSQLKRNSSIDGWRGIMAMLIISLHFDWQYGYPNFKTCYLAVEFFFILSGFFLMKQLSSLEEDEIDIAKVPSSILFSKFRRFFTLNLFCILILHTWFFLMNGGQSLMEYCNSFFDRVGEIFFLQCSGLSLQLLNLPAWYLSALLFGCYLLAVLFCMNRKVFQYLIAPAFICFTYAFISQTVGTLDIWSSAAFGFLSYGLIRGVGGLCTGCLLYSLYRFIGQRISANSILPKRKRNLFVFLDLINLVILFKLLIRRNPSQNDFLVIPCFCLIILFASLHQGLSSKIASLRPFVLLGKISLELYLCHWFILQIDEKFFTGLPYGINLILFFSLSILFAAILFHAIEPLFKNVGRKIIVFFKMGKALET